MNTKGYWITFLFRILKVKQMYEQLAYLDALSKAVFYSKVDWRMIKLLVLVTIEIMQLSK